MPKAMYSGLFSCCWEELGYPHGHHAVIRKKSQATSFSVPSNKVGSLSLGSLKDIWSVPSTSLMLLQGTGVGGHLEPGLEVVVVGQMGHSADMGRPGWIGM